MTTNTQRPIVFVVGAGASAEAGLPVGAELAQRISRLLGSDKDYHGYVQPPPKLLKAAVSMLKAQQGSEASNQLFKAAKEIRDAVSLMPSIDQYIDSKAGDSFVASLAKLAIVDEILAAEQHSTLYVDPSNYYNTLKFDDPRVNDSWYTKWFRLMAGSRTKDDLERLLGHVCMIVFNYDRCIEQFLTFAIMRYYSIDFHEAKKTLNHLEFVRPYGCVGAFCTSTDGAGVRFGHTIDSPAHLATSASGIETFSERRNSSTAEIETIRRRTSQAQLLVFLGFSFQQDNVKLIAPQTITSQTPRDRRAIYTTRGLSIPTRELIDKTLRD
ncbi:MAG: hypothetical protein ACRDAM_12775, partial [Casimicrobium sp.]